MMITRHNNRSKYIPVLGRKILEYIIPLIEHESLFGDFDEIYISYRQNKGRIRAFLWQWMQIAKFFIPFVFEIIFRSTAMLKNYITVSVRNLRKNKFFSIINV
ncbi:MAG: hypothetical protein GY863_07775, partial [bacterium]|nr:hypothetical protein [bacterium]